MIRANAVAEMSWNLKVSPATRLLLPLGKKTVQGRVGQLRMLRVSVTTPAVAVCHSLNWPKFGVPEVPVRVIVPSEMVTLIPADATPVAIAMISKNKIDVVSFFILGPPLKDRKSAVLQLPIEPNDKVEVRWGFAIYELSAFGLLGRDSSL
jgi:hypothetical protein